MVELEIQELNTGEKVGTFTFSILPRIGEEIVVPWAADSEGVRFFEIHDICHSALELSVGVDAIARATKAMVVEIT